MLYKISKKKKSQSFSRVFHIESKFEKITIKKEKRGSLMQTLRANNIYGNQNLNFLSYCCIQLDGWCGCWNFSLSYFKLDRLLKNCVFKWDVIFFRWMNFWNIKFFFKPWWWEFKLEKFKYTGTPSGMGGRIRAYRFGSCLMSEQRKILYKDMQFMRLDESVFLF